MLHVGYYSSQKKDTHDKLGHTHAPPARGASREEPVLELEARGGAPSDPRRRRSLRSFF